MEEHRLLGEMGRYLEVAPKLFQDGNYEGLYESALGLLGEVNQIPSDVLGDKRIIPESEKLLGGLLTLLDQGRLKDKNEAAITRATIETLSAIPQIIRYMGILGKEVTSK